MRDAIMGCLVYLFLLVVTITPGFPSEDVMKYTYKRKTNSDQERSTHKLLWMVFLGMIFTLLIIYIPYPCASYGNGGNGGGDECCPEVFIAPATKNVYPGDTFTIDVWTESGTDCPIRAVEYTLDWDPMEFELIDYVYNEASYGVTDDILVIPVEHDGVFQYAIARLTQNGNAPAPVSTYVLTCTFRALDTATPGTYTITTGTQMVDADSNLYTCVTTEDCDVTVLPEKARGCGKCGYMPKYWL